MGEKAKILGTGIFTFSKTVFERTFFQMVLQLGIVWQRVNGSPECFQKAMLLPQGPKTRDCVINS